MTIKRSAGAVIFRREKNKIYYLLLEYNPIGKIKKSYWGFAKGTIERNEEEVETIKREVREETGIDDLVFSKGFIEIDKYFFRYKNKTIFKSVYYLLAETKNKDVKLSFEHIDYKWLSFQEAIKKITFKSAKEILKKANDFLIKNK